jgi:hydrogenase maturation protein HypF
MERVLIEVRGTVQGVGFRPHVFTLATTLGLTGFAKNRGSGLFIDVEGDPAGLRTFVENLADTALRVRHRAERHHRRRRRARRTGRRDL